MEPTISGPIYYLLIVWAVVTGVFLLLLVWRTLLTSHEGDQIFLDSAQDHMAREQREMVAKIMKLSKPITTTGITAGDSAAGDCGDVDLPGAEEFLAAARLGGGFDHA